MHLFKERAITMLVLVAVVCLANGLIAVAASDDGLVGHWEFDEGGGTTAADSSGNGNDAVLNGIVGWYQLDEGNWCLQFTDPTWSGNWVEIPANTDLKVSEGTLVMWIYRTWDCGNPARLASFGNKDGGHPVVGFLDVNKLPYVVANNGQEYQGGAQEGIDNNRWYMLAITWDNNGDIAFYIDGFSAGVLPGAGIPVKFAEDDQSTDKLGMNYAGLMDDVRVYDTVLTEDDLLAIYDETVGRYPVE